MMSGLLGSLIGFTGSVIPAITDHFAKKQEYKFEIEKMEKQAELMRAGYDQEMKMYQQRASDDEHGRLIEHDVAITKNRTFIGALQSSVRPVITYSFFILFAIGFRILPSWISFMITFVSSTTVCNDSMNMVSLRYKSDFAKTVSCYNL